VIGGNGNASQLTLVDPAGGSSFDTVKLAQIEDGLVISPDGQWAYVLGEDSTRRGLIQTVDLAGLRLQKMVTPGQPVPVGFTSPSQIAISPTGKTLYVPFGALGTPQRPGGIAVIDVSEADCQEIPWRSIDGCPDCGHANCIVLATIDGYQTGFSIEDQTDPPSNPATDTSNSIARIDNRKGRRILPSTQALYELIQGLNP
jgi:DNA-binding beta-propeller fold protein YncE